MTGGLMQLSAYGAQDVYLTGNPQITFFKSVYRKYTNFSIENIKQNLLGSKNLSQNTNTVLKSKINRNGDLLTGITFMFDIPNIFSSYATNEANEKINYKFKWIKNIGTSIIQRVNISIGGQIIDEHYGEWLNIWSELTLKTDKVDIYNKMIGNIPEIYDPAHNQGNNGFYPSSSLNPSHTTDPDDFTNKMNPYRSPPSILGRTIYVPLVFWFCQYSGQSLPLIALQYHDIEILIELKPITDLYLLIETKQGETSEMKSYTKPNPLRSDQNIANFLSQTYGTEAYDVFYESNNTEYYNTLVENFVSNINATGNWELNPQLDITYVYLEDSERKRFANTTHEYLIEQVSRYSYLGLVGEKTLDIPALHPVKKIILVTKRNDIDIRNDWTNFTNWLLEEIAPWSVGNPNFQFQLDEYDSTDPTSDKWSGLLSDPNQLIIPNKGNAKYFKQNILNNATFLINGVERQSNREGSFYNLLQPFNNCIRGPKSGIYVYSFSLEDNIDFQPKGSCNFSRIKNPQLVVDLVDVPPNYSDNSSLQYKYMFDINIYVINYNILRIMAGMGSLAFSN